MFILCPTENPDVLFAKHLMKSKNDNAKLVRDIREIKDKIVNPNPECGFNKKFVTSPYMRRKPQ